MMEWKDAAEPAYVRRWRRALVVFVGIGLGMALHYDRVVTLVITWGDGAGAELRLSSQAGPSCAEHG